MLRRFALSCFVLASVVCLSAWRLSAPQGAAPVPVPPPAPTWHVLLDLGTGYDPKLEIHAQKGFAGHYEYMLRLASEGNLLVGGPLFDGVTAPKPTGAVILIKAKDEKMVREVLAADAFIQANVLSVVSVRPMHIGAGAWIPPAPRSDQAK